MEYLILWFLLGVISYGITYAYFARKYPNQEEKRSKLVFLLFFGPMSFFAAIYFLIDNNGIKKAFKYGFKL